MEIAVTSWLFFDPISAKQRSERSETEHVEKTRHEKRLFCANCHHPITHQDQRLVVQGSHEYRFTNPHGIIYLIACFREAAGSTPVGEATTEYTCFTGYAWRITQCAHCRLHLGWLFQLRGEYFHALITSRLTSAGQAPD
ncbi:MAG: cereblon family protein [Sulfuricaulis sp.]